MLTSIDSVKRKKKRDPKEKLETNARSFVKENKKVTPTVQLESQYIERVTDIIEDDLGLVNIDMEQRESLQRIVSMSVALYFVLIRESNDRTTRLTQ